jgi:hypothetical protein
VLSRLARSGWLALVCICVCAFACLARQAAELRARMVGVPARDLRSCLGPPSEFEEVEGRAVWVYQTRYAGPGEDVSIVIVRGGGAASALPPRVTSGDVARSTQSDTQQASRSKTLPPGSCLLVFELADGRVQRLETAGRTPGGAHAAAECALFVRSCAPPVPPRDR